MGNADATAALAADGHKGHFGFDGGFAVGQGRSLAEDDVACTDVFQTACKGQDIAFKRRAAIADVNACNNEHDVFEFGQKVMLLKKRPARFSRNRDSAHC